MTELAKLENRLKRKQKVYDETALKLQTTLDGVITEPVAYRELEKLKVQLTNVRDQAEPVVEAYEAVTGNTDVDAKIEEVEDRMRENEERYIDFKHLIKEKFPPAVVAAAINNITVQQAAQQSAPPPPPQQQHIRLQEVKIPQFSGERIEYPRFISMFTNNVHDRNDLSDVAKLTLFTSLLKGDALKRVESYPITPENYKVVRDVIETEYGKKDLIIDDHLKKLFQLMTAPPAASDAVFQTLYIATSSQARALKALGHNEDTIKSTLLTLLPDKMPSDMKLQWYRTINNKQLSNISLQELYDFIELELSVRARFKASTGLDTQVQKTSQDQHHHHKQKGKATMAALHVGANSTDVVLPCMFCSSKNHKSGQCPRSIEERKTQFAKQSRCYRCAKKGHGVKTCTRTCAHCWEPHHVYICQKMSDAVASKAPAATNGGGGKRKPKADFISTVSNRPAANNLVLQTFWITVAGPAGVRKCRVLLDGGAHLSYITQSLAEALGLKTKGVEKQNIGTFGGNVQEMTMPKMEVKLKTKINPINISVLQIPEICDPVPAITLGCWRDRITSQHMKMAAGVEMEQGERWDGRIDILIGVQDYYTIVTGRSFSLSTRLKAVETVFGWIVHGRLDHFEHTQNHSTVLLANQGEERRVDAMLQQLFDLDAIHPLDKVGSDENNPALAHFKETMRQLNDGQYELRMPLKENRPHLPTNRHIAEKQVRAQTKRWKKTSEGISILSKYNEALDNYMRDGQVEEIPPDEINSIDCHYLTHHAVIKPEKNTKIRPVFNGSLDKPSLNDCLHTGKNQVPLMTSILTRLRLHRIVITGDYRKAFLHISIAKEDRNLQRFLWWDDPMLEEPTLKHLRWKVSVFGLTCSPFQLESVLTHHVSKYEDRYPRTARMMLKNTFVDDVVGGAERRETAEEFINQANEIATAAKMSIQRWQTNDPVLQRKLDEKEKGIPEDQKDKPNSIFALFESSLKVLGSVWDREDDVFTFENSALEDYCESLKHRTCLRTVLSISARVYDVLGLISPVTIIARILMQSIWRRKLHWDQELPPEMKKEFWNWADDLKHVTSVAVPRHLFNNSQRPQHGQLHICCDASTKAYGAVAYIRTENEVGEVSIALVGSKTRVVPLQGHSVARIELMGAVLAVKLAKSILESLKDEIDLEAFYWTDSMVVLYWVNRDWYLWKTWVANRCRIIQESSERTAWRHIAGKENPADLCSRGVLASKLVEKDCIWWTGPKMLYKPQGQWTNTPFDKNVMNRADVSVETKTTTTTLVAHQNAPPPSLFNESRYGTFETVLRITARIQRGLSNTIRAYLDKPTRDGELTSMELQCAKNYWFRHLQEWAYPEELKALRKGKPIPRSSAILIFRPYLNPEDGLIKIDARTKLSANYSTSPNVPILPSKVPGIKGVPHFIKLFIRHVHRSVCHSGTTTTLGELRKQCWIIHGRQTVMQVLRKCVICNKHQRKAYQQPTAYLPAPRCTFAAPFDVSGLDLLGPFYTREHRPSKKKDDKSPADQTTKSKGARKAGSQAKRPRGRPPGKKNKPSNCKTTTNTTPLLEEETPAALQEGSGLAAETKNKTEEEPQEFKIWVLLFTCSTTRAVHLEVVMRIDTPEIIMAIERFIARRGAPSIIYSDNGTQLVKASKALTALWKLTIEGILQYAAREGILWNFIVEKAPWWGGFYERMIGTLKQLLWKCIGRAKLTVKELETVFCKIEAIMGVNYQFPPDHVPISHAR